MRKERDAWNKRFLEKIDAESHICETENSDATGNPLPEKDKHRIKWFHRERLEDSLTLKIGAQVVLCKNIDTEHGWLNGTIAPVISIHNNCITIENIKMGRRTVVTRMRQNLLFAGSSLQYFRNQFPLILGWALNVHKVQGMTLDKAYIVLNRNFYASGQAYVALSRVKSIDNLHLLEFDLTAVYLDPYYRSLLDWMKSVDKIGQFGHQGEYCSVDIDYPSRPKEPKQSLSRRKDSLKRKASSDTISEEKAMKQTRKDASANRKTRSIDNIECKKSMNHSYQRPPPSVQATSSYLCIFIDNVELKELLESVDLPPLDASKETYILQYTEVFDVILQILCNIDVAMTEPRFMHLDQRQQGHLHPVMQSYLIAVGTVGDGNCLFHSIWKHLFPKPQENVDTARFMRQITLYTIYKNENLYRRIVSALGLITI